MDELQQLDDWLAPLLAKLAPAQRRSLAREIARDLRRRQQQRIAAQKDPDGSTYEPRRHLLRERKGQVRRRAMFGKIRQVSYLKTLATPAEASVGFAGRVARIASVHQLGLRDRVRLDGPEYTYPIRKLLGLSADDQDFVRTFLLERLSGD